MAETSTPASLAIRRANGEANVRSPLAGEPEATAFGAGCAGASAFGASLFGAPAFGGETNFHPGYREWQRLLRRAAGEVA